MNKRLPRLLQPNARPYFILLIAFAAATYFFGQYSRLLASVMAGVIIFAAILLQIRVKRRNAKLLSYLESISDSMDVSVRDTPLPVLIHNTETGEIIWSNDRFAKIAGVDEPFFAGKASDVVPGYNWDWMMSGRNECEEPVQIGEKLYWVYGSIVLSNREYIAMTYWTDVTEYVEICKSYIDTRPVHALLMLDNYDELFKSMSAKEKSLLVSEIEEIISVWVSDKDGYLCKYDRDRYFFLFEERFLEGMVEENFSILEEIGSCVGAGGVVATLSIGIGKDGFTPQENYRFANLGMEMALSRGGNQAVVRNRYGFEFYGGKPQPVERRTKVKARVMANAFSELLIDASKVFVMGHRNADFDSLGSALGICCIARAKRTPAYIITNRSAGITAESYLDVIAGHPEYSGVFINEQEAVLMADKRTLLVIVDTNRPSQVESETLLLSCTRVAIIDHHRRAADYIENAVVNFLEPYASSSAELVTDMMINLIEDSGGILNVEAEALLAGIVLDTKSFSINTGSGTFEAAAYLKRAGADAESVKRLLQSDFDIVSKRYKLLRSAEICYGCIAIAASEDKQNKISIAQAADQLLEIKQITASFAVAKDGDTVCVSGRGIGDINVQVILEKLGGGGSQYTAGFQSDSKSVTEVLQLLRQAIDEYMKKNKRKTAR